jgi:AmmeMemoRadiSam system protein B
MPTSSKIRPSPIAGSWYPRDPEVLRRTVSDFIDSAMIPSLTGEVLGLVAPHAGHIYSGSTAGYAFHTVKGKSFDLVAVLSPMHDFHPSPFLTTAHEFFQTPLGDIPVAKDVLTQINRELASGGFSLTEVTNDREHSLEIELPFLQMALSKPFRLIPIMIRTQNPDDLQKMGLALAKAVKAKSVLIVASSDLSHFYPEKEAERLDAEMMKQIEAFSPEKAVQTEMEGKGFACGLGAIASMLWATRELGANKVQLLNHSTSADKTGDRQSVVGYGAAVILKV